MKIFEKLWKNFQNNPKGVLNVQKQAVNWSGIFKKIRSRCLHQSLPCAPNLIKKLIKKPLLQPGTRPELKWLFLW